jgi:hypothetical protein
MAHFLARRAQLCAGLLGPEACEDVMRGLHGAGAELLLVWRSDLAGPQLQRLLSHLAEYDVGKKRSDLRVCVCAADALVHGLLCMAPAGLLSISTACCC